MNRGTRYTLGRIIDIEIDPDDLEEVFVWVDTGNSHAGIHKDNCIRFNPKVGDKVKIDFWSNNIYKI